MNIPLKAFLPCYQRLLNSQANIDFLWGGRDGGRSRHIAQQAIVACLQEKYFRCLLIKKTFNTIKESQWQTIKDVCEEWGIDHLFKFYTAPLSIECVNGNKFLARGCDDAQSIKSIKDPNAAWYEELNQLTLHDFITVVTSLRTNKGRIKQWGSLNPEFEEDYEDNWWWKNFVLNRAYTGEYDWEVRVGTQTLKYSYTLTHSTYKNNPFVTPERMVFLEKLQEIDPYYYSVYTLGLPGRRVNNAPFCFAFSRDKHVGTTALNRAQQVYATFDFNKSPISCSIWQWYNNHLYAIESIKLDRSDIYALCDYLMLHYPNVSWLITGDATGRASNALVQDNINYYTVIKNKLRLSEGQIKTPSFNPPIKENQVLVNAVLALVNVTIDKVKCKSLIFDMENVRVAPDGSIEKKDRKDPAQQADLLDGFRYLCNTFFKWVLKS